MACLNDEAWNSNPSMLLNSLSLEEEEERDDHGGGGGGGAEALALQFPFERVFPVYAMGFSNPNNDDALLSAPNFGSDPIWHSVREEAKSEVPTCLKIHFFLFSF